MEVHRSLDNLPIFEKPVITFGSFDGIHKGHRTILKQVVSSAHDRNTQSVVISFDPHPREVIYPKDKTLQLISTVNEKIGILEDIDVDHFVLIPFKIEFSQISPQEYIENVVLKKFAPQLIIIGYDHRFGLNRSGGFQMLEEYGKDHDFSVEVIPAQSINNINISSTKIRKALNEGNIPVANELLGYTYSISGDVIQGDKIGRTIGFPTANISIDHPKKLIPQDGVYASEIEVKGRRYQGMLYIGKRSTISNEDEKRIEINIFDFDEEIYGEPVKVLFYKKIRDDEKFKNLKKLKHAIAIDGKAVKSYFRLISDEEKNSIATIAILNYNGSEMLESYLPKTLYSTEQEIDYLVIDNASNDDSVEYLKDYHPEVTLVELNENWGFAEGYNKGLEGVETKYTVLLNSDVLVTAQWLDPLIAKMESDIAIAACQPKILSLEEKNVFEYAGAGGGMIDRFGYPFCRGRLFQEVEVDNGQYDDETDVFWCSGAAMVIRTDLYKKFGGLDATFFAHQEEIDLCWRLKNAGYRLCYVPSSKVYHLGGGTLGYENPRKAYLNYRNNLRAIFKNEKDLFSVFTSRMILDLGSSFVFLLKGNFKLFPVIWRAYISVITSVFGLLKKRREIQTLTSRFKIYSPNGQGRFNINLPWSYFIKGKKKYSDLNLES